ncbi:MAG: heme exporter protein CcmD [Alphaproteobacteria bacterium]
MAEQITTFFEMGGYARFVWPAYAIAFLVMAGFVVTSWRTLRARRASLEALEAALPQRRRRRPGNERA